MTSGPRPQPQYTKYINAFDKRDAAVSAVHATSDTRERMKNRKFKIYRTDDYTTASRVQHCQTIQLTSIDEFVELFGNETLKPELERYVTESIDWTLDSGADFFGQITVSLMMQEQPARPSTYTAVFIINATPHEQFRTGHIIDTEFERNSAMHNTVNRLFYSNEFQSLGEYFTEINLLLHLADDDEMQRMMFGYFMDEDFYSEPFPDNDFKSAHSCMQAWDAVFGTETETETETDEQLTQTAPAPTFTVPPPPPCPVNDIGAVFRACYSD